MIVGVLRERASGERRVASVPATARLGGSHRFPDWTIVNLAQDATFMGQEILNPPSVEGWHTGTEWVDTGTLVERINSAALELGDVNQPGVPEIVEQLRSRHLVLSPNQFVDNCLDLAGGLEVSGNTRNELVKYVESQGDLRFDRHDLAPCSEQRVAELLQLIVATREYQLA